MPKVGDQVYLLWPKAKDPARQAWVPARITAVHDEDYVDLDDGSPHSNVVHWRAATADVRCWSEAPRKLYTGVLE